MRFTGLIVRRGTDDVELNVIGHSGSCAGEGLTRANRQALVALRPELTIIMFGINEEWRALAGDSNALTDFRRGMTLRARIARRTGRCVVVPHAPNLRPVVVQDRLRRVAEEAALASGCGFAPAFDRIWGYGGDSVQRGLTVDGIHPTAAGYRLMARNLAPLIARYRRCGGRTGCPPVHRESFYEPWWVTLSLAALLTGSAAYLRTRSSRVMSGRRSARPGEDN